MDHAVLHWSRSSRAFLLQTRNVWSTALALQGNLLPTSHRESIVQNRGRSLRGSIIRESAEAKFVETMAPGPGTNRDLIYILHHDCVHYHFHLFRRVSSTTGFVEQC